MWKGNRRNLVIIAFFLMHSHRFVAKSIVFVSFPVHYRSLCVRVALLCTWLEILAGMGAPFMHTYVYSCCYIMYLVANPRGARCSLCVCPHARIWCLPVCYHESRDKWWKQKPETRKKEQIETKVNEGEGEVSKCEKLFYIVKACRHSFLHNSAEEGSWKGGRKGLRCS